MTDQRHAAVRLRQRAIPHEALDLLWEFGSSVRSRGADSFYFDRAACQRAKKAFGRRLSARIDRLMNAYAIIADDGAIITAGWRRRRRA